MSGIPAPRVIEPAKIAGYLLDAAHPLGRAKARYFAAFGFTADAPVVLALALDRHGADRPIARTVESEFGVKYEVRCNIEFPDGRSPCIVSIWIRPAGETVHRFVTAYPAE